MLIMSNVFLKSLSNNYSNSQGEEINLDDILVVKSVLFENGDVEFMTKSGSHFETLGNLLDHALSIYRVVVISNQLTTFELLEVNNELTWCYVH